jgi:hypothetical protein
MERISQLERQEPAGGFKPTTPTREAESAGRLRSLAGAGAAILRENPALLVLGALFVATAALGRYFSKLELGASWLHPTEVLLLITLVVAITYVPWREWVDRLRASKALIPLLVLWAFGAVATIRGIADWGFGQVLHDVGLVEYSVLILIMAIVIRDRRDLVFMATLIALAGIGAIATNAVIRWGDADGDVQRMVAPIKGATGQCIALYIVWIVSRAAAGVRVRPWHYPVAVIGMIVIVLDASRSTWLAMLVGVVAIPILFARSPRRILAAGASAAALLAVGVALSFPADNVRANIDLDFGGSPNTSDIASSPGGHAHTGGTRGDGKADHQGQGGGKAIDHTIFHPFPSTDLLDSANRANGGVGSSWTTPFSAKTTALTIASNKFSATPGTYAGGVWNRTFKAEQEAFVTISGHNGGASVVLRAQDATHYYYVVFYDTEIQAYKVVGGTPTQILRATYPAGPHTHAKISTGAVVGARFVSNTLSVYLDGMRVGKTTDSAITSAGKIGFGSYFRADGSTSYDDFGGGVYNPDAPSLGSSQATSGTHTSTGASPPQGNFQGASSGAESQASAPQGNSQEASSGAESQASAPEGNSQGARTGAGSQRSEAPYYQLPTNQIRSRLRVLTAPELRRVRTLERRGKARKGILSYIDRRLKQGTAPSEQSSEESEESRTPVVGALENSFDTSTTENFNSRWRLEFWKYLLRQSVHDPVFGVGFGTPSHVRWQGTVHDGRTGDPLNEQDVTGPHNSFVNMLYRAGAPALLALLVLMLVAVIKLVPIAWRNAGESRALAIWLLAGLVITSIEASLNVALEGPFMGIFFWAVLGLGLLTPVILQSTSPVVDIAANQARRSR